ncbi:Uncharacterised protein [Chlamydia abortus]|uniref:Transposase n=1 Tax=Paenibacillus residui TaxID=629724 RepID=A0ABW3DA53_9BACL|nr:Uncharacterised protein [Chlamydia abortus]
MNRGLSEKATIYNYTLLKKCGYGKLPSSIYITILLLWGAGCFLWHYSGALGLLLALPAVHGLYYVLIRLIKRFTPWSADFSWLWTKNLPWNGYLPEGYIRNRFLLSIHMHLLLTGAAIIGAAYIWVPVPVFATFMFVHIWTLLPRLWILQQLKQVHPHGLIKITADELLLYST